MLDLKDRMIHAETHGFDLDDMESMLEWFYEDLTEDQMLHLVRRENYDVD